MATTERDMNLVSVPADIKEIVENLAANGMAPEADNVRLGHVLLLVPECAECGTVFTPPVFLGAVPGTNSEEASVICSRCSS